MITIQITNETGERVSFSLSADSLCVISLFLHFISFADNRLYDDSSALQSAVADFYNSNYGPVLLRDARFLKYMIDLFTGKL